MSDGSPSDIQEHMSHNDNDIQELGSRNDNIQERKSHNDNNIQKRAFAIMEMEEDDVPEWKRLKTLIHNLVDAWNRIHYPNAAKNTLEMCGAREEEVDILMQAWTRRAAILLEIIEELESNKIQKKCASPSMSENSKTVIARKQKVAVVNWKWWVSRHSPDNPNTKIVQIEKNYTVQWFPKLQAYRTTFYPLGTWLSRANYVWSCCSCRTKHHLEQHFLKVD